MLAPRGDSAGLTQAILREAGLAVELATDVTAFTALLGAGAGFAVVDEEALRDADLTALSGFVHDQPDWSDFPFILLTGRADALDRAPVAGQLLEALGNVTLVERPFHPTTLASLARAALRARLRQYDARRQVEEIREGERRLTLALAAGRLGAWALDLSTMTFDASAECKAHFGRSADQAFDYDALLACIHSDDRGDTEAAIARAIKQGEDYHVEHRCLWPDGSLHWVQVNGRIESEDGRPIRMAGVSHEITMRRRVAQRQAALLGLSDRLRLMNDAAEMSFAAAETLGTLLDVDRAGYGVIDLVRETVTLFQDWTKPGVVSLAGTLQLRDYGSYVDELKRGELVAIADVRSDPRTAKSLMSLDDMDARAFLNLPILDRGDFAALLFLTQSRVRPWLADEIDFVREVADRTQAAIERRHAELSLAELAGSLERQVEERTRERDRTWRNSQDLLAVISADGIFLAVNPAWTTILGWKAQDMVGRDHVGFSHPDDQQGSAAALLRVRGEGLNQYETRMRHRDGGYRWISWVASAEDGLVYASGRHITAEKEASLALAAAQDQLRQAQKMEAVGQLTGGLAHDFNNLLTGISGSLELMQVRIRQGRPEDVGRYVGMAQQAANRAAALTHRLLAFSRRQTLDPRPTNINRLIAGLEDLLRRSVGPTIEMEIVGAGGLWTTLIDPNQLENAVLNLCLNARDAMPDGGRLTIETANVWFDPLSARECDVPPGQYVSLAVTDTGTGMDSETIGRAFDPFFTTKPLGEGTGLGLSMIYGFVRQSGGQVRIYSEVGQGTTMRLYLPRSHAADDAEHPREPREPCVAHRIASSGETVLIVDDEPAVRMLVIDVLAELGYRAIEAGDGPAGLAILESPARVDLLVTDVGLPNGMNGRQLADAARVGRPGLKVLFITGYAENAVVGNGHLDPGMHVLTKPFAISTLAGRIRDLIAG